ncbi:hypothetical protein [Flavobacterium sp. I3-2]|uniref:hypothetical protein n=1 Tax=Flavobacterium sp. I3-2 TaxID=2748319 RepID=UPI0015AC89C0|nr:hypothetical protein [Flavobacterium sp. I3-2]
MKRISRIILVSFAIATLTLMSCGSKDQVLEKGTAIESTKAAVDAITSDKKANEGKRFTIEGYLNYTPLHRVYTNRYQTVHVNSEPNKKGEWIGDISMKWGENEKNKVFVTETTGETFFYDNEGKSLTNNDKVSISFSVSEDETYPIDIRIDKL